MMVCNGVDLKSAPRDSLIFYWLVRKEHKSNQLCQEPLPIILYLEKKYHLIVNPHHANRTYITEKKDPKRNIFSPTRIPHHVQGPYRLRSYWPTRRLPHKSHLAGS